MQMVAPRTKMFNGRRYYFSWGTYSRQEATNMAKDRRSHGYRVRIVTIPNIRGYFLYERGMRTN